MELVHMTTRRILIVDDDPKFRAFVSAGLTESGIEPSSAGSGDEALALVRETGLSQFDAILLDVMMPGRSGWELIEDLRSMGSCPPVIFVTARGEVEERVKGLRLGADDYIIKPFAFSELLARIDAVTRRSGASDGFEVGDLRIEPSRRRAWFGGQRIDLSPREFDLLRTLMAHAGRIMTRPELLREVWDIDFDPETNLVDVHVARLRRKLAPHGDQPIETVRLRGYRLTTGEAS